MGLNIPPIAIQFQDAQKCMQKKTLFPFHYRIKRIREGRQQHIAVDLGMADTLQNFCIGPGLRMSYVHARNLTYWQEKRTQVRGNYIS